MTSPSTQGLSILHSFEVPPLAEADIRRRVWLRRKKLSIEDVAKAVSKAGYAASVDLITTTTSKIILGFNNDEARTRLLSSGLKVGNQTLKINKVTMEPPLAAVTACGIDDGFADNDIDSIFERFGELKRSYKVKKKISNIEYFNGNRVFLFAQLNQDLPTHILINGKQIKLKQSISKSDHDSRLRGQMHVQNNENQLISQAAEVQIQDDTMETNNVDVPERTPPNSNPSSPKRPKNPTIFNDFRTFQRELPITFEKPVITSAGMHMVEDGIIQNLGARSWLYYADNFLDWVNTIACILTFSRPLDLDKNKLPEKFKQFYRGWLKSTEEQKRRFLQITMDQYTTRMNGKWKCEDIDLWKYYRTYYKQFLNC